MARRLGIDALDAYAAQTARLPRAEWPDALLLLGDQVYADELTPQNRRRILEEAGGGSGLPTRRAEAEARAGPRGAHPASGVRATITSPAQSPTQRPATPSGGER